MIEMMYIDHENTIDTGTTFLRRISRCTLELENKVKYDAIDAMWLIGPLDTESFDADADDYRRNFELLVTWIHSQEERHSG